MGKSTRAEAQIHGIRKRIPEFLVKNQGYCNANMIADEFRVPWTLADRALREFALQFQCRIDVNTQDEPATQFRFSLPLRQRQAHPSLTGHTLWLVGWTLRSAIRLCLSILLVLYGAFFLLLLMAAGQGKFQEITGWRRREGSNIWADGRRRILGFANEILHFVAGPPHRVGVPDSMLEVVYTFLAENAGSATCADIMALTGCTYSTADKFMTWLMLVDKATVHITDEGLLLYIFPEFRREGRGEHIPSVWIWQRYPTGGGLSQFFSRNQGSLPFIGLSFAGAVFASIWMRGQGIHDGLFRLVFADIPLWISSGAMLIPASRWVIALAGRRSRLVRQLQIDVMRVLHDEMRAFSCVHDLEKLVSRGSGVSSKTLRAHISTVLHAIDGARTVDEEGHDAIDSPSLRAEWKLSVMARDRLLAGATPPGNPLDLG